MAREIAGMPAVTPRRRKTARVLALAASVLLGPVDAVAGQSPTPSARELWDAYPLHAAPEPGATDRKQGPANGGRRVSAPATSSESGGGTGVAPPLAGLALAIGAMAMLWTFRAQPRPLRAVPPARGPRERRGAASVQAAPPDPSRSWTAEVQWQRSGANARFVVLARSGESDDRSVVAESASLSWPPTGPATVQALSDAVAELERGLLAAGWTPLPPGPEWFAKRFAWNAAAMAEPAAVAEPEEPAPAPHPDRPQERSGRFTRRPAWPEGTDQLWRCELRWDPGMANSRFEAIAYGPGERRGRIVGTSATFKWLLMADPDPAAPEYATELDRLVAALRFAGWEYVGRGAKWYSGRFVWRRDGTPPDRVESYVPAVRRAP
jgi:hypothetical protein